MQLREGGYAEAAGDGGGEGEERCVEGSAEGRGDEVRYAGGRGKGLAEGLALGFSVGGEEGVGDGVVGEGEVVEAFCVAYAVDGDFCHVVSTGL